MSRTWARRPGEPALWYDRFTVYCNLGPNRTLSAAYRHVAQRDGLTKKKVPDYWRRQAARWNWAVRAAAWDTAHAVATAGVGAVDGAEAVDPGEVRNGPDRRRMVEQLLAIVFSVLVQADLDGMSSEEARRALPTLRLFFKDLLAAHRLEVEADGQDEDGVLPFTADELRAAQDHLAVWQASWPMRGQRAPPQSLDAGTRWLPLRDVLARLYPDEAGARRLAAQGGLDASQIAFGGRAVDRWHAILTEAIFVDRLGDLVLVALAEYGNHPGLRSAIKRGLEY